MINKTLSMTERDGIEALVDKYSLAAVLQALCEITIGKAEDMCNYQDEALSDRWYAVTHHIENAAIAAEADCL